MKTYIWIEDREGKASYIFWKAFFRELCSEVIVEGKKNNSELVKAVKALWNEEDKYIIIYDNSFDNMQVCLERSLLETCVSEKRNVYLMDIICFEYILLEFDKLIDWIYAPIDELRTKRSGVIRARNQLVEMMGDGLFDYKTIKEIIEYDKHLDKHNIEQLSAKLLYDLTRNTGVEVSKGTIGECWITSCCDWVDRQEDDICGLDDDRLSVANKMKTIYTDTSLREKFAEAGLEVPLC